jgi:hypothetical protein
MLQSISCFDAEARAIFPDNWAVSAGMACLPLLGRGDAARQHGAPCAARYRALGIRVTKPIRHRAATYRARVVA